MSAASGKRRHVERSTRKVLARRRNFASMPRRVIAWSRTFVTSHGLKKDAVKTSLRSASGWELITLNGLGVVHAILPGSILRRVLWPGLPSDSRLTGSHPICARRTPRIFPFVIIHSVLHTHGECFITHPIRNGLSRKPIGCFGRAALSASW